MSLQNHDIDSIYQAALGLTEADRLALVQRMLESLEHNARSIEGTDLRPLLGLGKGLWGTADSIDEFLEKERNQWDG
jgi:hypothetical protein